MKKHFLLLISLIIVSCCQNVNKDAGDKNPLTLHYDRPAAFFEEALPIGNGRLGAKCVGCHLCRLVCPTGAICMSKRVAKPKR